MENDNKNKNNNIILFFLKMVVLFILFEIINNKVYPLISRSIFYGKYIREILPEMACVFIAIIVLILAKKTHVFTEKKEPFLKAITAGGFMLV